MNNSIQSSSDSHVRGSTSKPLVQILYLETCMVSPIVIMCVSLLWLDLYTISVFLYNFVSLALMPLIYMRCFKHRSVEQVSIQHYLKNRLNDASKQTIFGIVMFTVIYIVIVINYDICETYFKPQVIDKININFNKSYWNFALLVLLFGIVNPFLEEFFWRNFIPVAFFDLLGHPYNSSQVAGASSDSVASRTGRGFVNDNDDDIERRAASNISEGLMEEDSDAERKTIKKHEEICQILFCVHFASYHFFVVLHITNVLFAIIATIGLIIAGRVFLYINNKLGYIAVSLAHMGADIALCTLALVIFYNNKIL